MSWYPFKNVVNFFKDWKETGLGGAIRDTHLMRYFADWAENGGSPAIQKIKKIVEQTNTPGEAQTALTFARDAGRIMGGMLATPIAKKLVTAAAASVGVPPVAVNSVYTLANGLVDKAHAKEYAQLLADKGEAAALEAIKHKFAELADVAGVDAGPIVLGVTAGLTKVSPATVTIGVATGPVLRELSLSAAVRPIRETSAAPLLLAGAVLFLLAKR